MNMNRVINIYRDNWESEVIELAHSNHLICTGKKSDLQWFGTRLIQLLGKNSKTETGVIYGKLAVDFDDFCYQLCRSTPWGFEMGRNMNAVVDVLRGESAIERKFYLIHDAQYLYLNDFDNFRLLFEVFLDVSREHDERGENLKVIILLIEDQEKINLRKLLKHKEMDSIKALKIIQEE